MQFGFSYIGLLYLCMLFIPNLFWTKNTPKNYEKYVSNENRILKILESIGQILVACIVLIFRDFNIRTDSLWIIWLILSAIFMLLYEIYWIRYFKSESSLIGSPVAGATLPVIAFLLLGIYGKSIPLVLATIILGIGHIGIHINHKREIAELD